MIKRFSCAKGREKVFSLQKVTSQTLLQFYFYKTLQSKSSCSNSQTTSKKRVKTKMPLISST